MGIERNDQALFDFAGSNKLSLWGEVRDLRAENARLKRELAALKKAKKPKSKKPKSKKR